MTVHRLLLPFFSGTGNSYRAAQWLAAYAAGRGISSRVIPVDAGLDSAPQPGDMVGLVCPTHAFTAPWSMLRFAFRLPRAPKGPEAPQAFALLTRGSMKIGPVFVPGLEGTGAYALALILALKGYQVMGASGLDMPASWTALMPGMKPEDAALMDERARPKAERFLATMLDGRRRFRGFLPLLLGLILLPLTAAYLAMGRFFLAKLFYASDRCDGCGLCASACPTGSIRMARLPLGLSGGALRPYWLLTCESCTRCMNYCPRGAVEASYPFAALMIYLISLPPVAAFTGWLARILFENLGWRGQVVDTVIAYPLNLLVLILCYPIFHFALRARLLNRIVTALTPTRYYRRYRGAGLGALRKEQKAKEPNAATGHSHL